MRTDRRTSFFSPQRSQYFAWTLVCEYGASADVQFGAAVKEKCEADFLSRLKPPQKRAYQREMRVCDRKYRNQSGTMYISFAAFCRAEVAQRYSRQALKAAR